MLLFCFFIVNLLNNPLNLYSMKKILLSFLLLFTSITFAFSQNNVVTGKVTDQKDGSSLPGVTVSVKGSPTIGVQTDVNGKYSLSVPATAKTLVFKYIGFKELEIAITGSVLNVIMETDSKQLTEVLVVGYGTQKRQNVTGSISSISAKEIESTPVTSLEQAIQGKSAGVFVQADNGKLGQGIQIRVRGSSSVSAGTQPLYILDGIPITTDNLSSTSAATNPIADINFNDIESIQILKDASASAIYGARASNGVVVITTKKGKMGATKINFTAQYGNSKPSRHRKFLNAQQFVDYTKRAGVGAAKQDAAAGFYGDPADPQSLADALADYESFIESDLTYYAADSEGWKTGAVNTDWEKLAFQDAPQQQYDLNLSGGSEKTTYYIGGQYLDQKGIVVGNSFKRYSGRINLDNKVTSKLNIGMNLNFTNTINNRVSNDNAFSTPLQIVALSPITPLIDPRTNLLSGSLPGEAEDFPLYYNPLLSVDNARYKATVFRTIGNIYGNLEIAKGLAFRTEFGVDQLNQVEDSYYGTLTFRNTSTKNGFGQNSNTQVLNFNTNNYFSYKHVFGTNNALDVTLGTSYQRSRTTGNDVQGQELPSDAFKNLNAAAAIISGSSLNGEYSFLSYFLRANYAYKGKYLISGSARTDGSSRFGRNNRYGFFPAGSLGWVVSEEDFLKNNTTVSNLKLRVSYGLTGNAEIGNYSYLGLFSPANYNGIGGQAFTQLANPNLKWESTAQFDVGVDFGFFNNRLSGSVDYYKKNTKDLLLSVNLPGTTGLSSQTQNLGKLYNKGFELELSGDIFVGKFRWTSSINGSYNKNIVTDIQGQVLGTNDINRVIEGQPIGVFFGPEYAGVDPNNGDALYYLNTKDANGNYDRTKTNDYNQAQSVALGNPTPKYLAGFTNTFGYKGIDLSFTMQGAFGNKIYNGGGQYMSANGSNGYDNQTVDQLNYWDHVGQVTDVPEPRMYYGNGIGASSRYLSSGSYVRLKTVSLGYTLPKSVSQKLRVEKVRVFTNAYNLFLITKYKGWDPEVNSDYQSGNINLGVDFYSAPQPRTITFGINVSL